MTQEAAQQAERNRHDHHQHKEQPGPERLALDLMLRSLQVFIDTTLVIGIQAAGHEGLVR
ncbi:hypothetical protein BHU25_15560 [Pseudomonas vranovensis]|uniref:Uncharacterized protein n=1 Tax=Pseudomonas vranovensis TaxID=321661 RepID=A0A423DJL6_9PSED|nr:hypothetical protein BHU25_15560 [Pseudomonas vranovensis]